MIGIRELASLLASAVVLFGSVLVPAGDGTTVAIESAGEDTTRAFADSPVDLELTAQVLEFSTSRGTPPAPATLDGGFESIEFLVSASEPSAATMGEERVLLPEGSSVDVQGFSGTLNVESGEVGLTLTLQGTATSLEVQAPTANSLQTYTGSDPAIPVSDVVVDGEALQAGFEEGGAFQEIGFTVEPSSREDAELPILDTGPEVLPFEQTVRVRVQDFVGVLVVADAEREHLNLQLDGFGNVTVLGDQHRRNVSEDATVEYNDPNEDPVASFEYQPHPPQASETVHFRSDASDDVAIRSWDWSFGDGSRSQVEDPEHTYERSGTYEVKLTVTDALGRQNTTTSEVQVVNTRPIVSLQVEPHPPVEGEVTTLTAVANDRDGSIVHYNWSIPNRTLAQGSTVNHTFAERGVHDVEVVVTDDEGAQADAQEEVEVANAPPEADFHLEPEDPMARETVHLVSDSSDYGEGKVVNHTWQIDGVGVRYGETVETAFPADGPHNVSLEVRDDDGATDTQERTVDVQNAPPEAAIRIHPQPINPGSSVTFSAEVTDDDPVSKAEWTFSDGLDLSGERVSRVFVTGGTYDVTLRVQDADGAWTSTEEAFYVNKAPTVELVPIDQQEPTSELAVQTSELFTLGAQVDDPDSNETTFSWAVDGGSPAESAYCTVAPNGNESRMQCGWPDDGQHAIRVHARDEQGAVNTTKTLVLVLNRAPSINPTVITDVVNVDETVTLEANAGDSDGTVDSVRWRVDGQDAGLGESIQYQFQEAGNHTVGVSATDDDGAVESTTFTVEVNAKPEASISVDPQNPTAGQSVTFTADAYDPDGADSDLEYTWDFGDGTQASGAQVSHTYDTADTYWPHVKVTDVNGATVVRETKLDVEAPSLNSQLDVSPSPPQSGDETTLTVSVEDGREIEQIEWAFGDGHTQTTGAGVQSTNHTYDSPGVYTADVTVHADHGQSQRITAQVRVTGETPYELRFQPRLPDGQCLNLSSPKANVEGEHVETSTTIALDGGGDASWKTRSPCTLSYELPAGTWAPEDQFVVWLSAGPATSSRAFELDASGSLVDDDLRLRNVPLDFRTVEIVSPHQESQSDEQHTYANPAEDVYVRAEAEWVENTTVRGYTLEMETSYRGVDRLVGLSLGYHEDHVRITQDGTLYELVPAPILGAEAADARADSGPSLVYLPGQYRVDLIASSGPYSDMATRSFVEDPAGIFAALGDG